MMSHSAIKGWLFFLLTIAAPASFAQAKRPFPQHVKYFAGTIKPDNQSQVQLDNAVRSFYTQWKGRYIKNVPGKVESYVWFEGKGGKQCVSEGQGYGMVITAL